MVVITHLLASQLLTFQQSAMCGRLELARVFYTNSSIGRCSHVFGLLMRFARPLAIMPSADQVPVNKTHSTMLWPMWAVLIAGSTGSAFRAGRPPNLHITPDVRCDLVQAASAAGSLYRSPLAYVFAARAEHSSSSRLRRSHKKLRQLAKLARHPPPVTSIAGVA